MALRPPAALFRALYAAGLCAGLGVSCSGLTIVDITPDAGGSTDGGQQKVDSGVTADAGAIDAGAVDAGPAAPDLVVTAVTVDLVSPGARLTFGASIKNQGTAATPNGVIHGVLFTVDGNVATWSDRRTSSMAPGEEVHLTANDGPTGTSTWRLTSGVHEVTARVDDLNRIRNELDENNNTRSATLLADGGIADGGQR